MNRDDAVSHPDEALSALIDGEVGEAERRSLEAHVAECARCRGLLEDLKVLDRSVAAEAVPAPPPDLALRIAAALPARAGSASERTPAAAPAPVPMYRPFFRAPMPLAAAASLVVVTLVWLAWPGGRPNLEAPVPAPPPAAARPGDTTPAAPPPAVVPPVAAVPEARVESPAAGEPRTKAAAKPRVAAADPDARMLEQLRSLGYIGDPVKQSAERPAEPDAPGHAGAAPSKDVEADGDQAPHGFDRAAEATALAEAKAKADRQRQEEAIMTHAPAPAIQGAAAPPAAMGRADAERAEAVRVAGDSAGSEADQPTQRAVGFISASALAAFRAEPYAVRLAPSDTMYVASGEYACFVTISSEDARLLAERYAALRPAMTAPSRSEVGNVAPSAAAPQAAAPAGPEVRKQPAKRGESVTTIPMLDADLEARALILLLVRERYRSALEERCGPLPR